jgi:hypothetical protein
VRLIALTLLLTSCSPKPAEVREWVRRGDFAASCRELGECFGKHVRAWDVNEGKSCQISWEEYEDKAGRKVYHAVNTKNPEESLLICRALRDKR